MKKYVLLFIGLTFVSFINVNDGLTKEEREMAAAEMTKTQNHLLASLEGLSEAQLNFKSTPESWSIAECTEHIALSEYNIFGMLQGALAEEANPARREEVKMSNEQLLMIITDRSNKVKTFAAFEPSGKFGSVANSLAEFEKLRKEHIVYVNTTDDDLRNHFMELPFGTIDAYQILLFMSGHTERHVLQIEEVMAHEDFPKN